MGFVCGALVMCGVCCWCEVCISVRCVLFVSWLCDVYMNTVGGAIGLLPQNVSL